MRLVCKFHLVRGWCFVQGHNDHQCSGGGGGGGEGGGGGTCIVLQTPSSMRLVFCTGSYDVTMIINVWVGGGVGGYLGTQVIMVSVSESHTDV